MYNGIETKQYSKVAYMCDFLWRDKPGKSMALKMIEKINLKLTFDIWRIGF